MREQPLLRRRGRGHGKHRATARQQSQAYLLSGRDNHVDIGSLVQISQTFLESFVTLKGSLDVFKKDDESAIDAYGVKLGSKDKFDAFQSWLYGLAT
jgi:hypothetical protein